MERWKEGMEKEKKGLRVKLKIVNLLHRYGG
jgi:hypothetical protein